MLILERQLITAYRIPVAFLALVFMGFFQGLIQASIFSGVGGENFSRFDPVGNQQVSGNFIGLCFLVGQDQFTTCSFAQVLSIPLARPIFMREVSNRMYSASAYYLATSTSSVCMFILYPLISTLTSFYFFDMDNNSFGAMLEWMFILVLTALAGGFWGFAFGTFMKNEIVATQMNLLFLILFSFGAGFYANAGEDANFAI